jgi:hypothetical protein
LVGLVQLSRILLWSGLESGHPLTVGDAIGLWLELERVFTIVDGR